MARGGCKGESGETSPAKVAAYASVFMRSGVPLVAASRLTGNARVLVTMEISGAASVPVRLVRLVLPAVDGTGDVLL